MSAGTALARRPLGTTGLSVTPVCVGGGPLGSEPRTFGYEVPARRGIDTARRVLDGPINFLDTSNNYADGESERRVGVAVREAGGLPDGFVLATKVDRDGATGDFSAAQVRRSIEQSLERLGLDAVDLLYFHDPEHITFEQGMAPGGPVEELQRMHDEGIARHLGVAGGPVDLLARYLRTGVFEVLITHNRWTLVDRSAGPLLDEAVDLGVAVVNGAPFGGGVLAKGSAARTTYAYQQADPRIMEQITRMEAACAAFDVPLRVAALQFSTRDPRIVSTIVGMSRPERVDETVAMAERDVPDDLWERLEPLAAPADLWLY